jgi:fermentation-respiration switch protein FrsA (DUF1100 family)
MNKENKKPKNRLLSFKNLLKRSLFLLLIIYMLFLFVGCFMADKIIFQPRRASYSNLPEEIEIKVAEDVFITAVYLNNPGSEFTILYSHGNAEDLGNCLYTLQELHAKGFSVFAYDYEGYGKSNGSPTEDHCYRDIESAYIYLTEKLKVPADKIILYGRSVGSGPSCWLAEKKPVAGLILESPFVSAFRVLTVIPLVPFDKFNNISRISHINCPLLIFHGNRDIVVPFWHGKKLFEEAIEPKFFCPVKKAGHNNVEAVAGKKYWQAISDFENYLKQPKSKVNAASTDKSSETGT